MTLDKKAYYKDYYQANKEKIRAKSKAWYEANKEKMGAYIKTYVENNKEKVVEYKKKYRANNRQKCREASKVWREANKEKESAYRKANKEKIYVNNANRRALKFRATIRLTELDKFVIDEMYGLAQRRTKETGFAWEVDHIIPLTKGGLHKPTNLQVVPASWNRAKGNKSEDKYNDYN